MRRTHTAVAVLTLLVSAIPACRGDGGGRGGTRAETDTTGLVPDTLCADPTKANQLCSVIPHEVMVTLGFDYNGLQPTVQPSFDVFSWQSFVALNWPADAAGNPVGDSLGANPGASRVWEHWADANVLFQGDSATGPCGLQARRGGRKVLLQMAKNGQVVNPHATFDEAVGGPLLDRNLNFALFEKRLNGDEEAYLRRDSLLTVGGQEKADTIDFPKGKYDNDSTHTGGIVGAIEVKAAWRILVPAAGDDTTRYYHQQAVIYVPAENSPDSTAFCINAVVGLVGLHILHKTEKFQQWIWSTFEHEDNAPTCPAGGDCKVDANVRWSFYNPACPAATCPVNTPLKNSTFLNDSTFIWNKSQPYGSRYAFGGQYGSQITRVDTIYGPTDSVNVFWRRQVANTVWSHYRLIGSQWMAIVGGAKPDTVNAPNTLGNTTLESYLPTTSSCIGCHQFATTVGTPAKFGDFSFLLGLAGTKPRGMMAPFHLQAADAQRATLFGGGSRAPNGATGAPVQRR